MKLIILTSTISLWMSFASTAQTFYSKSTGALNTLATWGSNTDGTGTAPANFTTAGQTFNIQNRATANITATWTVSGAGSNVVVGDGINPVTFSTGTFTISGIFNVSASATLEVQSNSTFTLGTCATGSTVSYSGDLNQSVRAGTYDNLTLTNGTIARTKTASGAITVNGVLTVNTNNILAMATNALSGSFTNAGTGTITTTRTTSAFPASITWTQSIQYNATAAQSVLGGNYTNLTIGTGAKTATGNIDVSGILTTTGSLAMGSNVLSGTFAQAGTGNITTASTLPSGKTWTSATVTYNSGSLQTVSAGTYVGLNISGGGRTLEPSTIAISGAFTTGSGAITTTGSTVQFNGATTQAITITGQTNLTFDNLNVSAGTTKTFSNTLANITVNGTLNIASGTSLVLGNNRLASINTLSGTGTLSTASVSATPIPASVIWPYNVTFAATANDQIPAGTYQNLTITGGGTTTLQSDITVINDLTYNGALSLSTFQLFGVSGTISGTSTLTTLYTGVGDPIPSGKSWAGTVVYAATSNQTIVDAIQYNRLSLSGSNTTKTATGDLTIIATLTLTTCTLDLVTFQLTSAATITNTGTIRTQNTSATPLPSGITIGGTVNYNASAGQTIVHNTYTNLILSGSDTKTLSNLGDINISGTFTASSGTTLIPNASNVQFTGAAQTINLGAAGSFHNFRVVGTGNKTITAATGTLTIDNELEIQTGRTLTMNTNILSGVFTTVGTGTLTVTLASNAVSSGITWSFGVNYAGTTQSVLSGNYSTLIIGTGTKTATGTIDVSALLTMTGTLNMGANSLTGSFTTSGIGILTTTASTNALPSGITWTCTVSYTGTTQTVSGGNYNILTLSSGAKTATGNIDVSTTLTLTGSLDMQSNDLLGAFAQTGTGNLTSAANLPGGKTWTSAVVSYNSAGAQTVSDGTYVGLNISGGGDRNLNGTINVTGAFTASSGNIVGGISDVRLTGAAQTVVLGATGSFTNFRCLGTGNKTITAATGSLNVDGELEVLAGRTLVMNTNQLLGTLTSIIGSGIISTTATTSAIPAGHVWTQTVQYNATVAQQLIAGTYENLTIGATGTKTAQGNIVVNTGLVITGPLAMGVFDLSGGFTQTGTGAITTAGNLPDGKTWTSATVTYNSAGSQNVANGIYVALNIAGGSRVLSNTADINVSGNFTANTAAATYTTTGTTINFTGGAQTLTLHSSRFPFNNVSFTTSTTSTKTISGGGFNVAGTLNVGSNVTLNMATLPMGGNPTTITGTGTINTAAITTPLPANETWPCTVNYNSNGDQQVVAGTYSELRFTITTLTRARNVQGNITIDNSLVVNAPVGTTINTNMQTFNMVAGISFSTSFLGTGVKNFTTASTSATPLPSGVSWPNTVTYSSNTGTGTQTVVDGTYNNLTLSGSTRKVLSGNASVNDTLVFTTNGKLDLNGFNFETGGTIINTVTQGIIGNAASTLTCSGTESRTLSFDQTTPGTTNVVLNLVINSPGATITLGNSLRIPSTGVVTVTDGVLACGSDNLLLLSTSATQSAQIGQVGTTGNITGTLTVQRFIPGGARNWRFMASSVNTATGISSAWQQAIHITGSGSGGTLCGGAHTNGFDATSSNSPSMFTWNASTQSWVSVPNTATENLQTGIGYRIMYRGNRSQGCTLIDGTIPAPTPASATFSATGTPAVGDQVINCANTFAGWTLVGNPYQANLNLNLINRSANLSTRFFVFDPVFNNYRQYNVFDNVGTGSFAGNGTLAPGQAFYIQTISAGAASITFEEGDKTTGIAPAALFKNNLSNQLMVKLLDASNQYMSDALLTNYNDSRWNNDLHDGELFPMATDQLSTYTDDYLTALEINSVSSLQPNTSSVVYIDISRPVKEEGQYTLVFSRMAGFMPGHQFILKDTYTGKMVEFSDELNYTFVTNSQPASYSNKRIQLLISNTSSISPMPAVSVSTGLLLLHPNPAKDQVKVTLSSGFNANTHVFVTDIMGKMHEVAQQQLNDYEVSIQLNEMSKGVYFVVIEENGERITRKFVKD